jgi:thimet oligopeptidase
VVAAGSHTTAHRASRIALAVVAAVAVAVPPSFAARPAAGPAARRTELPLLSAEQIPARCDASLAQARSLIAALEALPLGRATPRTVLRPLNRIQIVVEDTESVADILGNVAPDKAARDAAEACLLRYNEFDTDLLQSEKLYRRVKAVRAAGAVGRKFRQDMLEAFEDAGIALPAAKRARMKAILQRIEEARQEFERNVRDNKTRLVFTPDEMRGLPGSYLEKARRDDQGNYLLGFEYPEFQPFMANAENEEARRRYQFEFTNRGTQRNIDLLGEVVDLRREAAGLFGMKSYAQFSLRRKMARTPGAAQKFLDEVKAQVRTAAAADLEELRVLKAGRLGKPLSEVAVHDWDVAYYRDKLRKARFDIDREALRAHFPTEAAIAWVMDISGALYGIEFRPATVPTWHPEVRYVDVHDKATGRFLGGIYLDLYPREGKYGHAANFGVRSSSTLEGRMPIAVLVANLDRKGLDNGELGTLVHEFGHTMHHVLARTAYALHGGSGLEWDFVEAPSQMYEEWARRAASLQRLVRFCNGCKPVDDDLVRRLQGARKLGIGLRYLDQHTLAQFDLALYGEQPVDPMATWIRLENETPLGHTPGTLFPSSFAHIVGGYAAGYYGYMWSEVLALDMLSPFGDDIMNAKAGRRFRAAVLAGGGERPAGRLVEEFLGRKPSNAAFFAEITGRRDLR